MQSPTGKVGIVVLFVMTLIAVCAPLAWGQRTTGTIIGNVTDPSGGAVPDAHIVARNAATNLERDTTTDGDGFYRIDLLPIGVYSVSVEKQGFRREIAKDITLQIDKVARINIALQLGELAQQVEVTAAPPLADTTTATIGDVIENKRIVTLPLNGRNFQQLALLTAGTTVGQQGGTQDFFGTASGSIGFVVNGGRDDQNNFLVDGINVIDHYFNTLTLTPSVDAIQEFKVLQNSYSAEAGMFGSGQVNVSIKSGTNAIHGSLYEFLRNDVFDAKNFFDLPGPKPPFRQNNFGGSFGGPVIKDRTFYFVSYEGLRVRQGQTVLSALPTANERNGIFVGAPGAPCLTDPNPAAPGGPFTFSTVGGVCTTTIPTARFGPVANRILSQFFTVPNGPGGPNAPGLNNVSVDKRIEDRNQVIARIDHRLSDKHNLFARYIWARSRQSFPFGKNILTFDPPPPPGFATPVPDDSQNLALGWTAVFKPSLINELHVGWNFYDGKRLASNNNVNFATDVLGLPAGPNTTIASRDRGFPAFSLSGISQFGDSDVFNPLFRKDSIYQISDNVSWTKGHHSIKYGGDIRFVYFDTTSNFFTRGFPNFNTVPLTGNFTADFLIDRPWAIVRTRGDTSGRFRTNLYGAYINDEWRATPRLTITGGVRYEVFPPIYERRNRLALYDINSKSIVVAGSVLPPEVTDPNGLAAQYDALLTALGFPATPSTCPTGRPAGSHCVHYVTGASMGLGRSLTKTDWKRIAPRIGIAYDLTGKGKTVIRAAFGIFNALRDWSGSSDSRNMLPFTQQMVLLDLNRLGVPLPPLGYAAMYSTVGNVPGSGIGPQINQPIGYTEQYTVNLQHQIGNDFVLEAAYVGVTGVNLNRLTTSNQEHLSGPQRGFPDNPEFGFFIQEDSGVSSSYQSGFVRAEKRFIQGLGFVASYTFSKSIDTVSSARENGGAPTREQDAFCLKCERALSNFDVRHRLVASYTYDLPWGKGRRWAHDYTGVGGKLLEGWQIGGIATLQTGNPFTPQFPGGANAGFRFERPDMLRDPNFPSDKRDPSLWFDPTAFVTPNFLVPPPGSTAADFAPGSAGRNILQGPGLKNFDFTIQKITAIQEKYALHFRAEFFNIFNHPNFNLPDRVFVPQASCAFLSTGTCPNVNPNFGKITSARLPRVIQFGLKFTF